MRFGAGKLSDFRSGQKFDFKQTLQDGVEIYHTGNVPSRFNAPPPFDRVVL
eukprot:m.294518 g.294518  ORF g.294518 m.294518 type:complete len:51 (-) comp16255_c1_seq1:835-987(-)